MSIPAARPRFRVIVVGCGAIARWFHIPVLAGHPEVEVVGFIDPAVVTTRKLAQRYGVPHVAAHLDEARAWSAEGAVIATPPSSHADLCVRLTEWGLHTMVEKPMALNAVDARRMVAAAAAAKRKLSVGLCRRLYPSVSLLRTIVQERTYGDLTGFDLEEGHVFDWPSATLAIMRRDEAGGGVLFDTGSHTLDQLLWITGMGFDVVEYADDSHGGIEANCEMRLRSLAPAIDGRVSLSRTKTLRNTLRFEFEHGVIEMSTTGRSRVELVKTAVAMPRSQPTWRHIMEVGSGGDPMDDSRAPFRAQVDDWLHAIQTDSVPTLSGASALPVVELIDECYRQRRPLAEPWHLFAPAATSVAPRFEPPALRVLVTGAAGFIGCRLVETLAERDQVAVRALVHRPGGASRLARLPVELVQGDLRRAADVDRAVKNCDVVINCAYGTDWSSVQAIRDVTVNGTSNLCHASARARVRLLIHLSTIMVYGQNTSGPIGEDTPLTSGGDGLYPETKREAEAVVRAAGRRGLAGTILRLANVYGPFSQPFTVRPIRLMRDGIPTVVDDGRSFSNTVYVDNVVEAIILALRDGRAGGLQVFNICDDDGYTWGQLMQAYSEALNLPVRRLSTAELVQREAAQRLLNRSNRSPLREIGRLAKAEETRALAGRIFRTRPAGPALRRLVDRAPAMRDWVLSRLDGRPPVYPPSEPVAEQPIDVWRFYLWPAEIKATSAREKLGQFTVVPRADALARTLLWARDSRLI